MNAVRWGGTIMLLFSGCTREAGPMPQDTVELYDAADPDNFAGPTSMPIDSFDFSTVHSVDWTLRVADASGAPVYDAAIEVTADGEVMHACRSDRKGTAAMRVTIPQAWPEMTIVVTKPFYATSTETLTIDELATGTVDVVLNNAQ